jgi:GNAT superfamily N-acetyltransferase
MIIRRAVDADAQAVAGVWLRSFRSVYGFPPAHTDREIRSWIRTTLIATHETWVAELDDRIVALLSVAPGWVDQLYVDPAAQGRGIGRVLLAHAMARQPDGLELWTFQANERARRFYARNGFSEAELTDGSGNEERQPDVRMVWRPERPTRP